MKTGVISHEQRMATMQRVLGQLRTEIKRRRIEPKAHGFELVRLGRPELPRPRRFGRRRTF